jgi:hypothetical protein
MEGAEAGADGEDDGCEDEVDEDEAEAAELVEEVVAEAGIDPAVAAANAKLVEQFKEQMKVGGTCRRRWCSGWGGGGVFVVCDDSCFWRCGREQRGRAPFWRSAQLAGWHSGEVPSWLAVLCQAGASCMLRLLWCHRAGLPPACVLQEEMKDRADMFDDMVQHEEKIRLGEAGWRERYYEVGASPAWQETTWREGRACRGAACARV